jgi:hypothetical protein
MVEKTPATFGENIPPVSQNPTEVARFTSILEGKGIGLQKFSTKNELATKLLRFTSNDDGDFVQYAPTTKPDGSRLRLFDIKRIDSGRTALEWFAAGVVQELDISRLMCIVTFNGDRWRLLCESTEQRTSLEQALSMAVAKRRNVATMTSQQTRLFRVWLSADTTQSGSIDEEELSAALRRNNIPAEPQFVRRLLEKYDEDQSGQLEFGEFVKLMNDLMERPNDTLDQLFASFAENGAITPSGFSRFLRDAQGESVSVPVARKRITTLAQGRAVDALGIDEFTGYLLDPTLNGWMKPEHEGVFMDMTQPLHHYYIAASHNTALTGDQYVSEATPEWVGMVLRQGARALELEVCDGAEEPLVHRRYSQCVPCSLRRVLEVIRAEAFAEGASRFPLIVMLELHTSAYQTVAVGKVLREVLGDRLLTSADLARAKKAGTTLSPASLIDRIVVCAAVDDTYAEECGKPADGIRAFEVQRAATPQPAVAVRDDAFLDVVTMRWVTKSAEWGATNAETDVASYSTEEIERVRRTSPWSKFIDMTRKMFVRAYPRAPDSSNVDFAPAMAAGSQLVAMNWQSCDEYMRQYEAHFRANGHAGYLLKPVYMRKPGLQPDPTAFRITVTVIQGIQLPQLPQADERVVRPLVTVFVSGTGDGQVRPKQTQAVNENGFCPVFDCHESFRVKGIDLGLLTIRISYVTEEGEFPLGEASIPLLSLRVGYRSVPLRSCASHAPLNDAALLCHFVVAKAGV